MDLHKNRIKRLFGEQSFIYYFLELEKDFIRLSDIAKHSPFTYTTLYRYVFKYDIIPAVKIQNVWKVPKEIIIDFFIQAKELRLIE